MFYKIFSLIFLFGYWLLITSVILRILIKRRSVPVSMSWLLAIYILPLVGIITYLLFGELNIGRQRIKRNEAMWSTILKFLETLKKCNHVFTIKNSKIADSIFQLCKHRQGIKGLRYNKICLLTNTNEAMQTLINDIMLAKHTINMIFYIWHNGGLVDKITEELISAAKRGVQCNLILDSSGSVNFFRSHLYRLMKKSGIHIVEALHINLLRIFFRRIDLRQHRKIVLIDHYISYTGSMNMVDPLFFKQNKKVGYWIDIMARIEGPITYIMNIIFSYDWETETGQRIFKKLNSNFVSFKKNSSKNVIQVIPSGPGFPEGMIHQGLLIAIYSAKKKIVITTPYLIPSDDLVHAICTAAQRGIEVHIIIPQKNDSILVSWASRAFFSEFLKAGVFIHQFTGGLLHTKSVQIDQQLSLIGTVNLDMRSLWINLEITLVIDDRDFSSTLEQLQKKYIISSCLIDINKWSKRPYWQRIIERIFYFFSPLL